MAIGALAGGRKPGSTGTGFASATAASAGGKPAGSGAGSICAGTAPGAGIAGLATLRWPPQAEGGQEKIRVHGPEAVPRLVDAEEAGAVRLFEDGIAAEGILLKNELFRTIRLPCLSAVIMVPFMAIIL